ncbi:amidohydrolase family protein [Aurantiacibacter gilvus]|uniref:Amidohydrolase family protein n=1 Tax=Aurantiacibacter gilvus TaxID=3139141 RepID=A0ABU9IGI5_9SPHN
MTDTFHSCHDHGRRTTFSRRGQHFVVDIHCHLHVREADEMIQAESPSSFGAHMKFTSPKTIEVNRAQFMGLARRGGVENRLADMDRLGIDVQAISPNPSQYYYNAPAEVGRLVSRLINDRIAATVAGNPDRFVGMGTVPLQNVEMAIAELRRCKSELGLRGIEINTNVDGADLHDRRLDPFWSAAEDAGVLIFIHPLGFTHAERMSEYYFNNLIGNPLESTLAIGHLIFGGVLDRHSGLRICVAHGGGYMPGYWGRMDHGWHARADCSADCLHKPSSYLRRLWLDTLVHDQDQLANLVRTHGADRLCLGTDYPFDMGEPDPVGFHSGLDDADLPKVLGLNAAGLLGIEAPEVTP